MTNDSDPLMDLVIKKEESEEITRRLLKEILGSWVFINEETKKLEFIPDTYSLSPADQILVLLSGKLAQKMLGFVENEKISQGKIVEFLEMIEEGTVKSSLHRLRKDHFVKKDGVGNFVSLPQLQKIKLRLSPVNTKK